MRAGRLISLLAVLVAAGCGTEPHATSVSLDVERDVYVRAGDGSITAQVTVVNGGDETVGLLGCPPGDPVNLHWSLERLLDGEWQVPDPHTFECFSGPLEVQDELAPDASRSFDLGWGIDPGQYRLRLYYVPSDAPPADRRPSEPSRTFTVE